MSKQDEGRSVWGRRELLRILGTGAAAAALPRAGHASGSGGIASDTRGAEGTTQEASGGGTNGGETQRADVVVVGAGFSGLTAARAVAKAGKKAVVLEARNRVGGRVKTGTIAGRTVDVGGMWAAATQTRILELIKEFGFELVPQFEAGKNITEANHKRFEGSGDTFGWGKKTDEEAARVIGKVDALSKEVPLEAPWKAAKAHEWDTMSAEDWFAKNTTNPEVLDTVRGLTRGILTADAYQVSFLYFLFYMRSGDSFVSQAGFGQGTTQAWTVRETMHGVAMKMAESFSAGSQGMGKGTIVFESPVRAISQTDAGVVVESDKGKWEAEYAIVCLPPPLALRIRYEPILPPRREILLQHMPMGSVVKYWVAYEKPFWRARGYSGLITSDELPSNLVCADSSLSDAGPGFLVGFMEASGGAEWTGKSMEERKRKVVERLVSFWGADAAQPIGYEDQDWPSDPWSRGCYMASPGPGILSGVGAEIRVPHGRVHWAGTETSDRWAGYIDGAVRSGERAAGEVLGRMGG
jgi:monoamine oxidase